MKSCSFLKPKPPSYFFMHIRSHDIQWIPFGLLTELLTQYLHIKLSNSVQILLGNKKTLIANVGRACDTVLISNSSPPRQLFLVPSVNTVLHPIFKITENSTFISPYTTGETKVSCTLIRFLKTQRLADDFFHFVVRIATKKHSGLCLIYFLPRRFFIESKHLAYLLRHICVCFTIDVRIVGKKHVS